MECKYNDLERPPSRWQVDPEENNFKRIVKLAFEFDKSLPRNLWNPFSDDFGENAKFLRGIIFIRPLHEEYCSWQIALVSSRRIFWPEHGVLYKTSEDKLSWPTHLHFSQIRIYNHEGMPCTLAYPQSYHLDWLRRNSTAFIEEIVVNDGEDSDWSMQFRSATRRHVLPWSLQGLRACPYV